MNQENMYSDRELVILCQQSSEGACFDALYERYVHIVYRKCLSYMRTKEDAEEATQDIWVKVYFALPSFRGESSFSTWIYRITSNHCITFLKKKRTFVSLDHLHEQGFDPEDIEEDMAVLTEQKTDVTKLLAQLSKDIKAILLMKYVDGYTYEDIAEMTDLGVSAVKMRIARAKKQLQKDLTHNQHE